MIEYHVIHRDEDLVRVREFLSETDETREVFDIRFPTVVAMNQQDIVGCFTTLDNDEAVMVGPVEAQNQRFILFRMAQAYEQYLRSVGVREYLVPVDANNTHLISILSKLYDSDPYAYSPTYVWFKRRIG